MQSLHVFLLKRNSMVLDPLVPLVRHQPWQGCTILNTSGISFGSRRLAESRFQRVIITVHLLGVLLHTNACSGLSRVRTELPSTARNPTPCATSSTNELRVYGPWLPWRSSVLVASPGENAYCAIPGRCAP